MIFLTLSKYNIELKWVRKFHYFQMNHLCRRHHRCCSVICFSHHLQIFSTFCCIQIWTILICASSAAIYCNISTKLYLIESKIVGSEIASAKINLSEKRNIESIDADGQYWMCHQLQSKIICRGHNGQHSRKSDKIIRLSHFPPKNQLNAFVFVVDFPFLAE